MILTRFKGKVNFLLNSITIKKSAHSMINSNGQLTTEFGENRGWERLLPIRITCLTQKVSTIKRQLSILRERVWCQIFMCFSISKKNLDLKMRFPKFNYCCQSITVNYNVFLFVNIVSTLNALVPWNLNHSLCHFCIIRCWVQNLHLYMLKLSSCKTGQLYQHESQVKCIVLLSEDYADHCSGVILA